jgi:hypothetical protein
VKLINEQVEPYLIDKWKTELTSVAKDGDVFVIRGVKANQT